MLDALILDFYSTLTQQNADLIFASIITPFLAALLTYEWLTGKFKNGKRTLTDWKMVGISYTMLSVVQRPAVLGVCYFILGALIPGSSGEWREFNQTHLLWCLLAFIAIDELLHGGTHYFSHKKISKNIILAKVQRFIKRAHRPHHLHGGSDGKGEMSAAHAPVQHWAFLFILPNMWFGAAMLYLGFLETFLIANLIKNAWVYNVHTNWNYDLYFLNHKNKYIRKGMYALCHIITFPTQHHQHHSRSKNSAKNMQNLFAIYDWLLWGTLVIEKERPTVYGWRQSEKESSSVLYRFFSNQPN